MLRSMDLTDYLRRTYGPILNCGLLGFRVYQSEERLYYKVLLQGEPSVYGNEVLEYEVDLLNRPLGCFSLQQSLAQNVAALCQQEKLLQGDGLIFPLEADRPAPSRPSARPEPSRPSARPEPSRPSARPEPSRPSARPEPSRPSARPEPSRPSARPEPSRPNARPAVPSRPTVRSNIPRPQGTLVLNTPVNMYQAKPLPVKAEPARKVTLQRAQRKRK